MLRVIPALMAAAPTGATPCLQHSYRAPSRAPKLLPNDHLSHALWKAYAAGAIADIEAEAIAELIHVRRGATRASQAPVGIPPGRCTIFKPRRLQRPPQRSKSIERRRTLAASGPLPPMLADVSPPGRWLFYGSSQKGNAGQCIKSVAEIAARAGVCHRLAQYAIRLGRVLINRDW